MRNELLYLYNVCKRKGHQRVLRHVALNLYEHEILGVLGKNDNSLSSLCEVLSGMITVDTGTVWYSGREVSFRSMLEARQNGIYLIRKESALFSNLSIAENIGGIKPFSWKDFFVFRHRLEEEIWEFLEENEIPLQINSRIEKMSLFERCQVEIARAIYNQAKILIFYQVGREFSTEEFKLFRLWLQKIKDLGISVIYMDTSLANLVETTDRMAVVTSGKIFGILERDEYDSHLIQTILMKKVPEKKPRALDRAERKLAFCTKKLNVSGTELNLEIHRGEIVGVYAESRTIEALFEGMAGQRDMEGSIFIRGKWLDAHSWKHPARYGVGCVTHVQTENFNFPNLSVYENLMLRSYGGYAHMGILNWRMIRFVAEESSRFYNISPNKLIIQLQQEDYLCNTALPFISWIIAKPELLVLNTVLETADETEKEYLYWLMDLCRQKGIAVLYCMNRDQEAMKICDKVYDARRISERQG